MKTIWFHMQGYRDLPDDFRDRYESIWVTPPNDELCHSPEVAKYLHWNLDELEMADDLGFDGLGLNEHHQNGYGFPISPNMIATVLARRKSNAALVIALPPSISAGRAGIPDRPPRLAVCPFAFARCAEIEEPRPICGG